MSPARPRDRPGPASAFDVQFRLASGLGAGPTNHYPGVSEGRGKGTDFATPSVPLPLWGVPGVSGIPEG
jgi:hypothetical protein